jgi:uncharacterized membrane protein (UPF0136 family)
MKRVVLTFGLISGAIMSAMMLITLPLLENIGSDKGLIIGYTTMVLAFLLVFFGIRSYRDTIGAGRISFLRALGVGLLIMLIASICYVVSWEVIYHNFMPDFVDKYVARATQEARNSGKSPEQIAQEIAQMKQMMALYNNNIFFNLAITLLEPLPVGLVMTLISAGILRRREPKESLGTGLPDLQN